MKRFIGLVALSLVCFAPACGGNGGTGDADGVTTDILAGDIQSDPGWTDAAGDSTASDTRQDLQVADGTGELPADAVTDPDAADSLTPSDTTETFEPDAVDVQFCLDAIPLACGDSFNHSTAANGRANQWSGYACTQRYEGGREALYVLSTDSNCVATVTLSNLETDIDLMWLSECSPWHARACSSTPVDIQDDESVTVSAIADEYQYIVVDGYDEDEGTYTISVACECHEPGQFRSQLAECAFQYADSTESEPTVPDSAACLDEPCSTDAACAASGSATAGRMCVTGNCVYCAQDTDCTAPAVCRAGRCVEKSVDCPAIPDCNEAGCHELEISETSCPTCVCATEFFNQCSIDDDCLPISHHPFKRCVNGRCAECRVDADCNNGVLQCLPPGICFSMLTHPSAIYGSWLIGWWGDLNHYSYFRFEHDGTVRRGSYVDDEDFWMDDIFLGWCSAAMDVTADQFVGTWEPEMTESGFLVINVDFQAICNPGDPQLSRWLVTMAPDGNSMTMKSVEYPDSVELLSYRLTPDIYCNAGFTSCVTPDYPMW